MKVRQIAFLLLLSASLSAQNSNTSPRLPEYTLPSPQSFAFQQFKGFETDFATGAVNVNIPLHTVVLKGSAEMTRFL